MPFQLGTMQAKPLRHFGILIQQQGERSKRETVLCIHVKDSCALHNEAQGDPVRSEKIADQES